MENKHLSFYICSRLFEKHQLVKYFIVLQVPSVKLISMSVSVILVRMAAHVTITLTTSCAAVLRDTRERCARLTSMSVYPNPV